VSKPLGAIGKINELLDGLEEIYGEGLKDYIGMSWRNILHSYLFSAWAEGYTTGFADHEKSLIRDE
jgi:hypothetical protein